MLPGEADPAQQLQALLGAEGVPVEGEGGGGRRGQAGVVRGPGADGHGRVPGHRGHLLDPDGHVGQPVLDRLELPDGPTELDPDLGVFGGRLEAPAGAAGMFGGHQGDHHLVDPPGGQRRQLAVRAHPDLVDLDHADPAGGVEAGQRGGPHPARRSGHVEEAPDHRTVGPAGRGQHDRRRRRPEQRPEGPRDDELALRTLIDHLEAGLRPEDEGGGRGPVDQPGQDDLGLGGRRRPRPPPPTRPRWAATARGPTTARSPRGGRQARRDRIPGRRTPRAGGSRASLGRPSPSTPVAAPRSRRRGAPSARSGGQWAPSQRRADVRCSSCSSEMAIGMAVPLSARASARPRTPR